jgi:fused signal recognition particle receptor
LQSAQARNIDILIADTAGRLHTQAHLMNELKKIKRVMQKMNAESPHETMLIVDAGIGQNALNQAKEFNEAIGLNSISVTKLDGTAKGGMVFAITQHTKLPIRFIGVGEQMEDLKPFEAEPFVAALFEGLTDDSVS